MLNVHTVKKKDVLLLADGAYSKGFHTVKFDGSKLANGIYYYRLTAPNFHQSKAMALMK